MTSCHEVTKNTKAHEEIFCTELIFVRLRDLRVFVARRLV